MPDSHRNFAVSTVATAPSPATSGTSLVVASGHGTRFPAAPFNATVWPAGAAPDPSNAEIVRVTVVSTDTLTITRAQESTSARSIVVGDQIAAGITAKTLTDAESVLNATGNNVTLPSSGTGVDGSLRLGRAATANEGRGTAVFDVKGVETPGAWTATDRFVVQTVPMASVNIAGGPASGHLVTVPAVWSYFGIVVPTVSANSGLTQVDAGFLASSGVYCPDTTGRAIGVQRLAAGYGYQTQESTVLSVVRVVTLPTEGSGYVAAGQLGYYAYCARADSSGRLALCAGIPQATPKAVSGTGVVVANDILMFWRIGSILIARCYNGTTYALKQELTSLVVPDDGNSWYFSTGAAALWEGTTTGKLAYFTGMC